MLYLRRRTFAVDGRLSAEWSRCLCYKARCARDNVAQLRRSSAGWMPARIGRCRAQASSRNSQGVVDGDRDNAGMSTAAPDRSAVLCC